MGFLGGFEWEQNPGGGAATGAIQDAMNQLGGMKTGSRWLRALNRGDTSLIGNPFQSQLAAENRLVDANMDPFLPPEIAEARANLQKNRNQEQAGSAFEDYVHQMAANAFNQKQENRRFKYGTSAELAKALADAQLGQYQGHQTQGWGGMVLGGALGAAQAASGLGWSPFGAKP